MAPGQVDTPPASFRKMFLWTEIFRTFQVAIDPKKLIAAAAGILVMSFGWFILSNIFYYKAPDRKDETRYGTKVIQEAFKGVKNPDGTDLTEQQYQQEAEKAFNRDKTQWENLDALAGPNGRLRTLPWYEYRGPNPYTFLTSIASGNPATIQSSFSGFFSGTLPMLVEPLVKLLLPVVKIVDPDVSPLTKLYLLLCLFWSVATWAFFGGVITRIAAMNFTGKERISLSQAVSFVKDKYLDYVLSPIVPVGIIGVVTLVMMVYAFVALIPAVGDWVLYGLGMPLVILGGLVMVVLLIGLIGYPLMYATISVEGTDTFDSLSRTYNYVYQAPWNYAWYSIVSILYGAIVTFALIFAGSMTVYLGKWAITQTPMNESVNRKPDYLFIYAPESFGWRQLFLKGSDLEMVEEKNADGTTKHGVYTYAKPEEAKSYNKNIWTMDKIGAGMVSFWLTAFFMIIVGFSYSYFWSASTMIYLLMRKKVDDLELDEIYIPTTPPPAPVAPSATVPPAPTTSLPVVPPPAPAPVVPPTPPAPLPPIPVAPPVVPPPDAPPMEAK
ncbi:MAG: hypothetical protein ACRC8S_05950 [Fimbriiglobus sp.]